MAFLAGFGFFVLVILLATFFPRTSFVVTALVLALKMGFVTDTNSIVPILSIVLVILAFIADIITLDILSVDL